MLYGYVKRALKSLGIGFWVAMDLKNSWIKMDKHINIGA